jgi:hypothetical protein
MYKECSLYIKTPLLLKELVVLLITITGVRRRTMLTTRGNRTSTMAIRTTTIRTTTTMFGLFGFLNKQARGPGGKLPGLCVF